MNPRIRQVLFDFDEVLASYHHEKRIAALATSCGCAHEHVREVLFTSGLEREYDGGRIDTATYLGRLGEGLGCTVGEDAWVASRVAGSVADAGVLACVEALDPALSLGILTNNGTLMARAIEHIIAPVHARFAGRVWCSGALQLRKPDPDIFRVVLEALGWEAASTLFIDDSFANVQAARGVGLQADTIRDARTLRRMLKRFGLA